MNVDLLKSEMEMLSEQIKTLVGTSNHDQLVDCLDRMRELAEQIEMEASLFEEDDEDFDSFPEGPLKDVDVTVTLNNFELSEIIEKLIWHEQYWGANPDNDPLIFKLKSSIQYEKFEKAD